MRASIASEENLDDALFLLGCLGSDIFFYDRLPPPLFRKNQKKIGNAFHNIDASDWFAALRSEFGVQNKALVLGLLCHFALDAAVHPYIESQATGADHSRFEALIDSVLLPTFSERENPFAGLPSVPRTASADAFWAELTSALFQKQVQGVFSRSYRNFLTAARFLFDPYGRKLSFVRGVERLVGKRGKLSGFFVSPHHKDENDCLNSKRTAWAPHWAPERISTASYAQLFDGAVSEAVRLTTLYLNGEFDIISAALTGRSMQRGDL